MSTPSHDIDAHGQVTPKRNATSWLPPLMVAVTTLVAFWPVLWNGFINFDDEITFLSNPYYRGLGWTQLHWMWRTRHLNMYRPLTWVTYGMDYELWGLTPFGYHLTSLLLHAANASLVYIVARRLLLIGSGERTAGAPALAGSAAIAALVFAIHPLRVEPVAWASDRATVLSALFFLLCIWAYLKFADASSNAPASKHWLVGSVSFYALSLLSKPTALGLPIVLIVLDVYPLGRMPLWDVSPQTRRLWWEKVPFFLCALAAVPVAIYVKTGGSAAVSRSDLLVALWAPDFYFWKMLVPVDLSLYELPPHLDLSPSKLLAVPATTIALVAVRRRWPAGLAVWICYLALLAPTLGIVRYGPQIAADRYTYLPSLGWAILAGAVALYGWTAWQDRRIGLAPAGLLAGGTVAILMVLGTLTWKQAQVWRDSQTFWTHVLRTNPNSSVAHNNLGQSLVQHGRWDEATPHFKRAVELRPNDPEANNNWGAALVRAGNLDAAARYFRRAVELKPGHASAHSNLGGVLMMQGKRDEAVGQFSTALQLDPNLAQARQNLEAALGAAPHQSRP
jgi:hypothetical protein